MRVLVQHYGDVNNYGDVLFPRIVAMLLKRVHPAVEITYASSTGSSFGALSSVRLDEVSGSFDIALMAGGEVVHRYDTMLRDIFSRGGLSSIASPTDVVFGVAHAKADQRLWIGLGVPPPTAESQDSVSRVLRKLTHISVRGRRSAKIMADLGRSPVVIPDLGWAIPELAKHEGWRDYSDFSNSERDYIVVQAIPGLGEYDTAMIASVLCEIEVANHCDVVLMGITDCWDDSRDLHRINEQAGGRFAVVGSERSYEERGAILLGAAAFIGQSMHGAVTAMAAGRPAVLVYPPSNDQKFRELFEMVGIPQFRTTMWSQVPDRLTVAQQHQQQVRSFAGFASEMLNTYAYTLLKA